MKDRSPLKQIQQLLLCWGKLVFVPEVSILPPMQTYRPRFPAFLAVRIVLAGLGWLALTAPGRAQVAVASITTSTSDLSNQNTNGAAFERTTVAITQFKDTAGNIYDANTVAGAAYVRRNTTAGNANNSSMWYTDVDGNGKFDATYATTYASLLLGNNILRGSDNTFANGTDATSGNIERLDFVFSASGITSNISTSFAVFDRGAIGVHDNVKIAVITGWDSVNNVPTSYGGTLVSLDSSNYGNTNLTPDFAYNLFRYTNGDNLGSPYWNDNTETGSQGLGGAIVSMADLGITAGTTIYGYSLMAYEVTTGGNMANLVNWNNATYYATNTTNATGTGGIDLSAVNGVLYNRRVPEPSTYGAVFLGLTATFFGWRRWRRGISAQTA